MYTETNEPEIPRTKPRRRRYEACIETSQRSGDLGPTEIERLMTGVLRAYRWQYILSGAQHPRFGTILSDLVTSAQADRVARALAPSVG